MIGARGNNLKSIDIEFPLGVLCVVTGVSGAGKSTLIEETLYPALRQRITREALTTSPFADLTGGDELAHAVFLDQSPLARSSRSNPVTYLKAFDEIRKTFAATHDAKLRNYDAGRFSFNVEGGRCDKCEGAGLLAIDMQFLPNVLIKCPEMSGTSYRPEILEICGLQPEISPKSSTRPFAANHSVFFDIAVRCSLGSVRWSTSAWTT